MWNYRAQQVEIVKPKLQPAKPQIEHKSPAKALRDSERKLENFILGKIDEAVKDRDREQLQMEDEISLIDGECLKAVEATKFVDSGFGPHPVKGEEVATIDKDFIDIHTGDVLRSRMVRHPTLIRLRA
jgi:hypothetical protein